MALFNEILSARYNRLLQRLLSMKGGAPAPQLGSDLAAGITLESDRPEWKFLAGEWYGSASLSVAADVANFTVVGLFNGQLTGVQCVCEAALIVNGGGAALAFQARIGVTTALATPVRGESLDLRWMGKQSSCLVGKNSEVAPTGRQVGLITVPANTSQLYPIPQGIVLPPNSTAPVSTVIPNFAIESNAINTGFTVVFFWRERALEASEASSGT